ncbi:C-type lectin domain family 12 member B-like isoform X2 [Gymnodraco acuticeps]|uniref:C-type lectin domain family 12 member B-like isoform X2 n=1 Tax=Gymnodraco acuticeps TaxID=8218 RepID=A0A6P8TUI6_GYMAC|nr:C-type lectin domain family 12 member B-like isoform X2 [Gymnodraco acuticeps]
MAEGEEEVNYASVVFKAGNNPPPAAKRGEETVYGEVKAQNETKNEDSAGRRRFQHLACCLGILCVILLGGIIGVCVYLTLIHESGPNELKENSSLLANNTKLSLENANLTSDNKNLEDQLGNLTQAYNVSERNVKDLSAGVQELTTKNKELENQKKNLKQKIQNLTTNWNELSISRAQWNIDSYCLGNADNKCQPCQKGWSLTEPSCYAYNDAQPANQKTWEEARGDCRGKNSDLAVAHDSDEKIVIINKYSPGSLGTNGFWIGLRVEDGKWKWVDGSDLTDSSWIVPPTDGRCALFYKGRNTWSSVSCGEKHQWICQKKALSV